MSSKYAALPDLDQSQDVYETPDLASDISTLPTTTESVYDTSPDIDHSEVQLRAARERFQDTQVDATDVDFSDRIAAKKKSYITSTRRRRRRNEDGVEEAESSGGEDDEYGVESPEKRLARLKRELEELKGEIAQRGQGAAESSRDEEGTTLTAGVEELAAALRSLTVADADADERGAQARLARRLATGTGAAMTATKPLPNTAPGGRAVEDESGTTATYTVTYSPNYKSSHALSKVADFEERITLLEKVLGLPQSLLAAGQPLPMHSLIPNLNEISKQVSVLAASTHSSFDSASRRVKQLTAETQKLAEARKAANAVAAEGADPLKNDETLAKVNALYGVLPTIEKLSPLLPATLDRLRTLRIIHQDAARAHEALKDVESKQEEMAVEIKNWEEALEKVEGVMKESTEAVQENVQKVEGWVRAIEEKMDA